MNHHHRAPPSGTSRWRSFPITIAFVGFAAIAAFYLYTEHKAHLFGALPYLLILACPVLHIFMHGGHGGHGGHSGHGAGGPPEKASGEQPPADPVPSKPNKTSQSTQGGHHHG